MPEYGNETVVAIIGSYLATRLPNTKTEEKHTEATMSPEEENLLATKYWDYGSNW